MNCRRPGGSPGRHAPVTGITSSLIAMRTCAEIPRVSGYFGAGSSWLGRLGGAETRFEVGEDVVERLEPDRQSHEPGRDAGQLLLGHVELTVRGARGMDR